MHWHGLCTQETVTLAWPLCASPGGLGKLRPEQGAHDPEEVGTTSLLPIQAGLKSPRPEVLPASPGLDPDSAPIAGHLDITCLPLPTHSWSPSETLIPGPCPSSSRLSPPHIAPPPGSLPALLQTTKTPLPNGPAHPDVQALARAVPLAGRTLSQLILPITRGTSPSAPPSLSVPTGRLPSPLPTARGQREAPGPCPPKHSGCPRLGQCCKGPLSAESILGVFLTLQQP